MQNFKRTILVVAAMLVSLSGFIDYAEAAQAPSPPKCPSNKAKLVVAKAGGDYTSIATALVNSTPTAASPCVIEVWPGTYAENITMKSYMHLKGTGRDMVTLQPLGDVSPYTGITISGLTNVTISDISIKQGIYGSTGIKIDGNSTSIVIQDSNFDAENVQAENSTVTFRDNTFLNADMDVWSTALIVSGNTFTGGGGLTFNSSDATITSNTFSGSSVGVNFWADGYSVTISGNTVSNVTVKGISGGATTLKVINNVVTNSGGRGIELNAGDGFISGNKSTGNSSDGISVYCWTNCTGISTISGNTSIGNGANGIVASGNHTVMYNKTTGNNLDLSVPSSLLPNVSFNTFDTVSGSYAGAFNVRGNGTPW